MYHISKTTKQTDKGRWVLLEHLPPILSPRILLLIFLYAMAFTLLLLGLKMLHLEHKISLAGSQLTSMQATENNESLLLYQQETNQQIQQNIASQIIRLHVIANSDSDEDQALKLKVRDAIIQNLQSELAHVTSIAEARSIIVSQIPEIEKTAQQVIEQEGYPYTVNATLGQRYFPVKVYGDLTFPAGDYEALCLEIGNAGGHNWWCVLFPSLCFVDETYAVVPEKSKEKLQQSLSREEYASLQNNTTASSKKNAGKTGKQTQDNAKEDKKASQKKKKKQSSQVKLHSAIYDWITSR